MAGIFIPDIFSGYIQGRRQAIADNWNDLNQYNNVLSGQLKNAFNMQTFGDAAQIAHNKALSSDASTALTGATADLGIAEAGQALSQGLPATQVAAKIAQLEATKATIMRRAQQQIEYADAQIERIKANAQAQAGSIDPTITNGGQLLPDAGAPAGLNDPLAADGSTSLNQ